MKYKSKLNQIRAFLEMEVKLEQMTLDNGTVIEAEMFEPDAEVFVVTEEDRIPMPVGEFTLEDGRILVVAQEGVIAEIKEPAPPEEEAAAEEEPELEKEEAAKPKKIVESISKELFFSEDQKNEIKQMFVEFKADLLEEPKAEVKEEPKKEELKKEELEVEPIKPSPEAHIEEKKKTLFSQKRSKNIRDTVMSKIANIKH